MRAIFTLGLALAGSVPVVGPTKKPISLALLPVRHPSRLRIRGADNMQRMLISGETAKVGDAATLDYSRQATYLSSDPNVAVVTRDGVVVPRGNGTAQITATFGDQQTVVKATVTDFSHEPPVSFRNQVVPILTKHGCNAGGCHGEQLGQNNFKLSLFGFDPDFDYNAIVKEARGRRLMPAAPDSSLLLLQGRRGGAPWRRPAARSPTRAEYGLLRRWVHKARPRAPTRTRRSCRIECFPKAASSACNAQQQIWSRPSIPTAPAATSPGRPSSRATNATWPSSMRSG